MVADRKTVAENFHHWTLGFTEAEDLAYPELIDLILRLRLIRPYLAIDFGTDPYNYKKDFVEGLLQQGQTYPGRKRRRVEGVNKECHDNVMALIQEQPHLHAIRGWAVNTGWKGHSWGWDPIKKIVYETTAYDWRNYFGQRVRLAGSQNTGDIKS